LFNLRSAENPTESADGANTTEVVRYVRRRKFGRKRRSVYVKQRIVNKPESIHPTNHDEHSQEYISRRRDSNEEKEKTPPPKSPPKQPTFKQLTLDQFLKKLPSVQEKVPEITPEDKNPQEEIISEVNNEESRLPRRTKRLSNTPHVSKSETDLVKMANGTSFDTLKKPIGESFEFRI
jgi:hypothetical protein